MDSTAPDFPSTAEVRAALTSFSIKQLTELSRLSGIPMTTIHKVQSGRTKNPGVETVRGFWPHIPTVRAALEVESDSTRAIESRAA